jgi:hypothetical protein
VSFYAAITGNDAEGCQYLAAKMVAITEAVST